VNTCLCVVSRPVGAKYGSAAALSYGRSYRSPRNGGQSTTGDGNSGGNEDDGITGDETT
jgi:hypothetical protein